MNRHSLRETVHQMAKTVERRGPDGEGVWVDESGTVALGHRRLSILDLSPQGAQPMVGRRFCVVFNGEIYNHRSIASELKTLGYQFRGHSDTEVLVAAFEEWGVELTLDKLVGMFAIAAWDKKSRKLYLIRDRLGEKPLYYSSVNGVLVFGSTLNAVREHPTLRGAQVDRRALGLYLRYGYVPCPYSIYENINKLPPGSLLVLPGDCDTLGFGSGGTREGGIEPVKYWDVASRQFRSSNIKTVGSDEVYRRALDSLLRDAVSKQLVADVPVGGFLSGGVDSSVVVSIMQAVSEKQVNTFTIGFEELEFNEAEHAKEVARYLGTNHTELYVTSKMALDTIPNLSIAYDEPFSDSSQIPSLLLCSMARQHATVCLSGDGGDELFCGYNRYIYAADIAKVLSYPHQLRSLVSKLIALCPPVVLYRCVQAVSPFFPKLRSLNNANIRSRMAKLTLSMTAESLVELYRGLISCWTNPSAVIAGDLSGAVELIRDSKIAADLLPIEQMMLWDLQTYLPDDNLVKTDRAAMYSSLETRCPLLDHRLVEFALGLPLDQKIRGGASKWLLRQVLYEYVPKRLIERPKMGFSVPIGKWLRFELRDWAEFLLDKQRLFHGGHFLADPVRAIWAEHLSGRHDHSAKLWAILMFEAWVERQR